MNNKTKPNLGQHSKYIDALRALAEQVILKKVNRENSWEVMGMDGFLRVARAIASPGLIIQLAERHVSGSLWCKLSVPPSMRIKLTLE